MSHDFTEFDIFKKRLSDKWRSVSGYDIETIDKSVFEGFKGLIYSAVLRKLDAEVFIRTNCRRAIKLSKNIKLPNSNAIPDYKGNLNKYLESGF